MANREDGKTLSRRGLFRRLAAGLGMAGAATARPLSARAAEPPAETGGYRKSEHVRKIYAAARH